ncbi:MAG TPA: hypothetical protein VMU82_16985 [Acetobacteraceae bacterium]|nr:hypothetical protein [Acetobacteraceae bacterium]
MIVDKRERPPDRNAPGKDDRISGWSLHSPGEAVGELRDGRPADVRACRGIKRDRTRHEHDGKERADRTPSDQPQCPHHMAISSNVPFSGAMRVPRRGMRARNAVGLRRVMTTCASAAYFGAGAAGGFIIPPPPAGPRIMPPAARAPPLIAEHCVIMLVMATIMLDIAIIMFDMAIMCCPPIIPPPIMPIMPFPPIIPGEPALPFPPIIEPGATVAGGGAAQAAGMGAIGVAAIRAISPAAASRALEFVCMVMFLHMD